MAYVSLKRYIELENENNTLRQKLENSVPKKRIRNRIKELEKEQQDNSDYCTIQAIILDYENLLEER